METRGSDHSYEVGDIINVQGECFSIEGITDGTTLKLKHTFHWWDRFKCWLWAMTTFPTWLIIRAALPVLPERHPWHGRKFELHDWYYGATLETKQASYLLWTTVICLSVIAIKFWSVR